MQKHLEEIIKSVKQSGNESAINKTDELINFLGEEGYEKFRDLL